MTLIACRLNDVEFQVLLDTCADTCVTHPSLIKALELTIIPRASHSIQGFGGTTTRTACLCRLKLALEHSVYVGEFMLCDYDSPPDICFHMVYGPGYGCLSRAGMVVDTCKRDVILPDDY